MCHGNRQQNLLALWTPELGSSRGGGRGGWGCQAVAHRNTPGLTGLSNRWSRPLPMALAACRKRWTGGSCLHNPRPVHPRRARPHAPALAHGSPRARGREGGVGGVDTGPRASSSSVSSRFGLCAPKSTKSSPSLPSAAPQGHSDKRQPQDPSLSEVWSRSEWASTARRVSLPQGNAEHTRERASARIQRAYVGSGGGAYVQSCVAGWKLARMR